MPQRMEMVCGLRHCSVAIAVNVIEPGSRNVVNECDAGDSAGELLNNFVIEAMDQNESFQNSFTQGSGLSVFFKQSAGVAEDVMHNQRDVMLLSRLAEPGHVFQGSVIGWRVGDSAVSQHTDELKILRVTPIQPRVGANSVIQSCRQIQNARPSFGIDVRMISQRQETVAVDSFKRRAISVWLIAMHYLY